MELITGATGIVGTHVLLECALRGPVRAIQRKQSDLSIVGRIFRHYREDADELLQRVQWYEADLQDMDALNEAMAGVRHVYHTAAIVSFDPKDASAMQRINTEGTANIVNAGLEQGVERLCHVSSTAAIGKAPGGTDRTETTPWMADKRTSAYAISKYEAELEVYRGIAEGLDAVIVNPCVVLGPGISGRSSMTLVERFRNGMRFYPPGSNSVVDARDVASCMIQLMEKGASGGRYLLVGESLSYRKLFSELSIAFGNPEPTNALRPWMLELGWRVERARSVLTGSKPFITAATASSALVTRSYSAAKAEALLGHTFRKADEAVKNVVRFVQGT